MRMPCPAGILPPMSMTTTPTSAPGLRHRRPPGAATAAKSPGPTSGTTAPGQPTPTPGAGETPDQTLARAQAAAQAKRLNEASGICEDVLASNPDYPAALALLGIIMALKNDPDRGVEVSAQGDLAAARHPQLVRASEFDVPQHLPDG